MRLRSFRAPTLAAAMAEVRASLGSEALILGSRRVAGGVEVTAALEESAPQREPPPLVPPPIPLRAPPKPAGSSLAEEARLSHLAWHGVPLSLARRLRAGPLPFALSLSLRFAALPLGPDAAPIMLVGPPGAGKTLTAARLATRLVMGGQRPLVIGADAARAGAGEQLAAFVRVLGLDLAEAADPGEIGACLRRRAHAAAVIDAPGGNPFCASEVAALVGMAQAAQAKLVAVLPAGLDAAEAGDLAAAYAAMGAALLVATRLDLARRLGAVLAAAMHLPLAEAGIGPGVADGLVPATPDLLARRLLAGAGAKRTLA